MDTKEAASQLNNSQYGEEGSKELFAQMKAAGLVAVFGASDDLVELRGAINNEVGAYDGGTVHLTRVGLLQNDCDSERCPHFEKLKSTASTIEAVWSEGEYSWQYRTTIPHETFVVMEDDETYCLGIVFALADVL